MTFFLKEFDPSTQPARQGPDMRPTGFWEGVGAATSRMMRDTNANLQRQQQVSRETEDVVTQAYPLLGEKAVLDRLKSKGMVPETQEALPPDAIRYNEKAKAEVMAMAQEAAAADPGRWSNIDLTEEGVQARVTERRQIEEQDEALTLEMMPGGRTVAELLGGMTGAMADIRQIPFMLVSGGGSLLSMMGRQAIANATAEAVTLPSMYETAAELDKADPNPVQQIAIGALGGAGFSAIFDGLPIAARRAFGYYRERQKIAPVEGVDPVHQSAATAAAEDALMKGDDPVAAADAILSKPEALVLRYDQRTDIDPFEAPWWSGPREPLVPDVQPRTDQEPIKKPQTDAELAQEAVDMLKATDDKRSRPLAAWIKRSGPPTAQQVKAAAKSGKPVRAYDPQFDKRIDPDGPFGQELKARGVNNKTYPGLFKKGGRGDLDNLVASEMEENFPGISAAAGVDGDYLDRNGLLEVLIRDAQGDSSWLQTRADVMRAESQAAELENPNRTAVQDYQDQVQAPSGFYVDRDMYEFTGGDVDGAIASDFDAWAAERGFDRILTPRERDEILAQLRKDGGEAEYLVEQALARELDDAERLPESATGNPAAAGGSPDAIALAGQATGRAADTGGRGPAFERTAAGDQSVIPGIDPITERQRLEAGQNARLGNGTRGPDSEIGGLFDPADKVRRDLFDDPASPKAEPVQSSMREGMRDVVADEDFMVDLGDGPRSAKSLLDEMDGDEDFAAVLDACGKRAVTE